MRTRQKPIYRDETSEVTECYNNVKMEVSEDENMKRSVKITFVLIFIIGLAIWFIKQLAPSIIPDSMSGFLSVISIVFILAGIVYMGLCAKKKIKPFDFKE